MNLFMTIGLPGSGKSTWARVQGVPIVNPDSIRLSIHGTAFDARHEGLVWWTTKMMVDSLFLAGHNDVILDATSIKLAARSTWKEYRRIYVCFDVPIDVCMERVRKANKDYLVPVIERMAQEYQRPALDEAPCFSPTYKVFGINKFLREGKT